VFEEPHRVFLSSKPDPRWINNKTVKTYLITAESWAMRKLIGRDTCITPETVSLGYSFAITYLASLCPMPYVRGFEIRNHTQCGSCSCGEEKPQLPVTFVGPTAHSSER